MPAYVAFLRGINVGGKNKIPMAELRALALELGLSEPKTHLQSGNLLFGSDGCRETVRVKARAEGFFIRQTGASGQYGVCTIEMEPLPSGSGFVFENRVVDGSIPKEYIRGCEEGIREGLSSGVLAGYQVIDIKVSLIEGKYHEVDSNENAFKQAGLIAFRDAMKKCNPVLKETSESELEHLLERASHEKFGFAVDYHVRSVDHLKKIKAANPFPQEAIDDPSHLVVAFFKSALDPKACEDLRAAIRGREQIREAGREAYLIYPDGIGDSKLTNSMLDSKLRQKGTARNWNTILKLTEIGG